MTGQKRYVITSEKLFKVFGDVHWYPSLPYPYKYANLVAEKGIVSAITEVLSSDNSAGGLLSLISKGGGAVLGQDLLRVMQLLVDIEIKSFRD